MSRHKSIAIYQHPCGGFEIRETGKGVLGALELLRDAEISAEAISIANETGITPRKLAEQRAELLKIIKRARPYIEHTIISMPAHICGPEANCDSDCEHKARSCKLLADIESAIAKVKGETQ